MKIAHTKEYEVPDAPDCTECDHAHIGRFNAVCGVFGGYCKDTIIKGKKALEPVPECLEARKKGEG